VPLKKRVRCEKIGEGEDGSTRYICIISDREYNVTVKPDGSVDISPTVVLPGPREYKRILEELREKGERVVV